VPDGVRLYAVIESPKNERVRRYRRLRKRNFRYREGLFIIEGLQCVAEALRSPHAPECIICNHKGRESLEAYTDLIKARNIPCLTARDEVIDSLSDTVTPQGIIAVSPLVHVGIEAICDSNPAAVLVADRVRDPGNLGNMIRIADAAGVGGMAICAESADLYNPKTVRSSAGSLFHIPLAVGGEASENINVLKKAGFTVLAADAHAGTVMWELEWPERLALVVGNESWGIPEDESSLVDGLVRVPIIGEAESLNVAAAAAVLLYEAARCRNVRDADREDF
jgi:RNA methyltransferase, TrmH family